MSYFKTCPHCGAALDPGEACDCVASRYAMLNLANREKFDAMIAILLKQQRTAPSAANTESGKETP